MATLLDGEGRRCDEEKLEEFLQPQDIELAKRIPVSYCVHRDTWRWVHETHRRYIVRSGCRVVTEQVQTTRLDNSDFWSVVWKAHVPLKVKHHLWRALINTLPCNEILRSRHVEVMIACLICAYNAETISHALLYCLAAKEIWLQSYVGWQN